MSENRAFWRSVHFLGRPFSLAALLVILVNDSILRHFWPSVVSGKLSDLAWMFVAPAAVTAGLAWAAPKGLRRHEWVLAGIGFGGTAASFTLLKTVPAFRDTVLALWQAGLGFPAAAVLDFTDLVALLSVAAAGWLWLRERPIAVSFPLRTVFVVPLLALLTLADAAAPDYGIACLENRDGEIVAFSSYQSFSSPDGGLTWNAGKFTRELCNEDGPADAELRLEPAGLRFRFRPGQSIESSTDGTQWEVAYRLAPLTEVDKAYYQKVQMGNPSLRPAPLAGLVDAQHGNVIFAMGHQGVLVRQGSGAWTWAAVGSYRRAEAESAWSFIVTVLNGEIVLTVALIFLILSLGAIIRRRHLVMTLLIGTGWLGWGLLPLLFPPALSTQYMTGITLLAAFVIAALALLMGVIGSILLARASAGTFWRLLAVAGAGGLISFLPYVLWSFNLLSQYYVAESLALILGGAAGVMGMNLVRNRGQTLQK